MSRHHYRVWDPLDETYVFPYAINFQESLMFVQLTDTERVWKPLPSELEQALGLQDMNGKDVFENDIVHYDGYTDPLQIMWCEHDCAYFVCEPNDECRLPLDYVYSMHFDCLEVIGHIHEPQYKI